MYNFVITTINKDGFSLTIPCKTLDDVKEQLAEELTYDGQKATIEVIDYNEVWSEFTAWLTKASDGLWIPDMADNKDVNNWIRYQDIPYWKRDIVLKMVHDFNNRD